MKEQVIRNLINTIKVLLLAYRLKRATKGQLIVTSLTQEQAGLASMRAGRFTLTYETSRGTELQILA